MANQNGESVAFSAYYAGNLKILGDLCQALDSIGQHSVSLAKELMLLLDSFTDPVDYQSVTQKRDRLQSYFDLVSHNVSGNKVDINFNELSQDYIRSELADNHLRNEEWIKMMMGPVGLIVITMTAVIDLKGKAVNRHE